MQTLLKAARPAAEAEQMRAYSIATAEPESDAIRCPACQVDLSSELDAATAAPVLVNAPVAPRSRPATGFAIAALVLAIGVGFLIPILCSFLAIGIGVVALCTSNGKGSAVKRLAIASVILGIVGVLGTVAVLSGA